MCAIEVICCIVHACISTSLQVVITYRALVNIGNVILLDIMIPVSEWVNCTLLRIFFKSLFLKKSLFEAFYHENASEML